MGYISVKLLEGWWGQAGVGLFWGKAMFVARGGGEGDVGGDFMRGGMRRCEGFALVWLCGLLGMDGGVV